MQQSTVERLRDEPVIRFGVDLRSTEERYRQALWGANRPATIETPHLVVTTGTQPVAKPAV